MKKISESAAFVVTNCDFKSDIDFKEELKQSETLKEIGEIKDIAIKANIPLPMNFPLPVAALQIGSANVVYVVPNKRVSIEVSDYLTGKDSIKALLNAISNMRLPEINAIGLNFTARYNTGEKRLNMFNSCIHKKFPDWSNNTGFEVLLPLDLDNKWGCKATYKISKIAGGNNENGEFEEYIYEIFSNYHFKVTSDKAKLTLRLNELEVILGRIDTLHNDFDEKCEKIIEL